MTTANGRLFMTLLGKFGQLYEANKEHPRLRYKQYKWGIGKKSTRALQTFDPKMMLNHP